MSETKTHWKKLMDSSKYFGCYCFEDDKDIIVTISNVAREMVIGEGGKSEECLVIHFTGNIKPLICNSTNCKAISKLFKTPYIEEWAGRRIQLYPDRNVKFGRDIVEGVRVRPFHPTVEKEEEIKCGGCGNVIEKFENMSPQQLASYTAKKYGKPLCAKCAAVAKAESEKGEDVL